MKTRLIIPVFFLVLLNGCAQTSEQAGGSGSQTTTAEVMMRNNDTNRDGVVSRAEAAALQSRLAQAFDRYDLNQDGMLTMDELNTVNARRR